MLKAAICTAASPVILLLFSHNCRQYHRSKQLCSNIIFTFRFSYFAFSQVWFPTVQDVLHADWQDVWHSPHPPFLTVLFSVCVFSVLMCFIFTPPNFAHIAFVIIAHTARFLKYFFTHPSGFSSCNHPTKHSTSDAKCKCQKQISCPRRNLTVHSK